MSGPASSREASRKANTAAGFDGDDEDDGMPTIPAYTLADARKSSLLVSTALVEAQSNLKNLKWQHEREQKRRRSNKAVTPADVGFVEADGNGEAAATAPARRLSKTDIAYMSAMLPRLRTASTHPAPGGGGAARVRPSLISEQQRQSVLVTSLGPGTSRLRSSIEQAAPSPSALVRLPPIPLAQLPGSKAGATSFFGNARCVSLGSGGRFSHVAAASPPQVPAAAPGVYLDSTVILEGEKNSLSFHLSVHLLRHGWIRAYTEFFRFAHLQQHGKALKEKQPQAEGGPLNGTAAAATTPGPSEQDLVWLQGTLREMEEARRQSAFSRVIRAGESLAKFFEDMSLKQLAEQRRSSSQGNDSHLGLLQLAESLWDLCIKQADESLLTMLQLQSQYQYAMFCERHRRYKEAIDGLSKLVRQAEMEVAELRRSSTSDSPGDVPTEMVGRSPVAKTATADVIDYHELVALLREAQSRLLRCCLALGEELQRTPEEAQVWYEKAAVLALAIKTTGASHRTPSIASVLSGSSDVALADHPEAFLADLLSAQAAAYAALGSVSQRLGSVVRALEFEKRRLQVAREMCDEVLVCDATLRVASLAEQLGKKADALHSFESALGVARAMNQTVDDAVEAPTSLVSAAERKKWMCRATLQMGQALLERGRREEAVRCFSESFGQALLLNAATCHHAPISATSNDENAPQEVNSDYLERQELEDQARVAVGFSQGEHYFATAGGGRGFLPIVCYDISAQITWMSKGIL